MATDPTRISDPATRALAMEIAELKRTVESLQAGQRSTQLGNSSIENGSLKVKDRDGFLRLFVGKQPDGTFGLGAANGAAPPVPNTPILEATVAGVSVGWNGDFSTGLRPGDFSHVAVHVSPSGETFIAGESNQYGTLTHAGTVAVAPLDENTDYWCRLIAWNTSGQPSLASFTVGPVRPAAVVATQVLADVVGTLQLKNDAVTAAKVAVGAIGLDKVSFTAADLGSIATYAQSSAPTGGSIATGSLWLDTDDGNKLYRFNGGSWVLATDADIATALSAAQAAQTAAAQALDAATDAEAKADGKVDIFYQTSPPTGATLGDLWLDTDDGNKLYRYNGSSWIVAADQRIVSALANAATAQSTADGKIRAFYQTSAPTSGMATGDLWYDTDNGNAASRYNGTAWTPLPVGTDAIANNAITGDKVVARTIQALHIAVEQIFAEHIAAGTITGDKIKALAIVAGHIAANQIEAGHIKAGAITANKLAAVLVVASQIIAGTENGPRLQFGPSGLTQFTGDSLNSIAMKLGADPAGGNYLTIVDPADGTALASIGSDGTMAARAFAVTGPLTVDGTDLYDLLYGQARGCIARAFTANNSPTVPTTFGAEVGWLEVSWLQELGRLYEISTPPAVAQTGAVGMVLRVTNDGTTPTVNSPALCAPSVTANGSSAQIVGFAGSDTYYGVVRVLLTVQNRQTGAAGFFSVANTGNRMQLVVKDVGPLVSYTGGATSGSGGNAQPTAQVRTYPAVWSRSYNSVSTPYLHQGKHPSKSTHDGSQLGFNDSQIRSDLANATINKIELYLYANYWINVGGGTVVLGTHNQAPGITGRFGYPTEQWPANQVLTRDRMRWSLKKPEGRWVTLPVAIGGELRDNVCKGFVLDSSTVTGGDGDQYYGAFDNTQPASEGRKPFALRITFTK